MASFYTPVNLLFTNYYKQKQKLEKSMINKKCCLTKSVHTLRLYFQDSPPSSVAEMRYNNSFKWVFITFKIKFCTRIYHFVFISQNNTTFYIIPHQMLITLMLTKDTNFIKHFPFSMQLSRFIFKVFLFSIMRHQMGALCYGKSFW